MPKSRHDIKRRVEMHLVQEKSFYRVVQLSEIRENSLKLLSSSSFFCLLKSESECSAIIDEALVGDFSPEQISKNRWAAFKLVGQFDFDETGILSRLICPISESGLGVFVVSSFDTDYLLIQEKDLPQLQVLSHISLELQKDVGDE